MFNNPIFFSLVFLFASAGEAFTQPDLRKYKTTPGGVHYLFHKQQKKRHAAPGNPGDTYIVNLKFGAEGQGLVFNSEAEGNGPIEYKVEAKRFNGDIVEAILMMSAGDSVTLYIPADSMYRDKFRPEFAEEAGWLRYEIGVVAIYSPEELAARNREERLSRINEELKSLRSYLSENGHAEVFDADSVLIVWHRRGNGAKPLSGDLIGVHYRGKLLSGYTFDSSFDRNQPIFLNTASGMVIEGWERALPHLAEGDSATIYIPSPLAYGKRGAGDAIPPHAALAFDINLLMVYDSLKVFREDSLILAAMLHHQGIEAEWHTDGFWYRMDRVGEGRPPQNGDTIIIHLTEQLLGGHVTFSTKMGQERRLQAIAGAGMLVEGVEAALRLMPPGSRATLWLPAPLAYADRLGGTSPPGTPIICEVQVLEVRQK